MRLSTILCWILQGRIQDFKLGGGGGGAHLKKLRRAEGGGKNFGVFRMKNHDFTPKKSYFSNFRGGGGARLIFGVFHVKNHDFTPTKSYFSNFRGGGGGGALNFWGISCEKSRFYAKKKSYFFQF